MAVRKCPKCRLTIKGKYCEEAKRLLREHLVEAHGYDRHRAGMVAAYTPCSE